MSSQDVDSHARRRVFIGDIQGCADEFDDLLDAVAFDPATDAIFAVGDLVNRGPDSARVLRRMIELGADSVLGNHDLHLLGCAVGIRKPRRGDTLTNVLDAPDCESLLDWLRRRPLLRIWDDVIAVHAGLHPAWQDVAAVAQPLERAIRAGTLPLQDADLRFLTSVRHCNAAGERPADDQRPGPEFRPWDDFYRGERTVVFGHWAVRGLVVRARVRGLDTGCVWGGALSAWIAEEDRIVSVPARRAYKAFTAS